MDAKCERRDVGSISVVKETNFESDIASCSGKPRVPMGRDERNGAAVLQIKTLINPSLRKWKGPRLCLNHCIIMQPFLLSIPELVLCTVAYKEAITPGRDNCNYYLL